MDLADELGTTLPVDPDPDLPAAEGIGAASHERVEIPQLPLPQLDSIDLETGEGVRGRIALLGEPGPSSNQEPDPEEQGCAGH